MRLRRLAVCTALFGAFATASATARLTDPAPRLRLPALRRAPAPRTDPVDPRDDRAPAAEFERAAAELAAAPAVTTHRRPVGTWTARGGYTSPPAVIRFKKLHGLRGQAIPRYPLVFVHGIVGWRRIRVGPFYADYFSGIRTELKRYGVKLLVTRSTDFASVATRAAQVKAEIDAFMAETGAEKVNLIAHSMGGIDSRYLITHLGMADKVASLTTVSSPHQGSWFADFFMNWAWENERFRKVWRKIGIPHEAIPDMSVKKMQEEFNPSTPNMPQVRYFSFSAKQPLYLMPPPLNLMGTVCKVMERAAVGERWSKKGAALAKFIMPREVHRRLREAADRPMMFGGPPSWVRPEFAGLNDGIIPTSSAIWGEHQATLTGDHFEQVGWLGSFPAVRFYRNVLTMLSDGGL